MEIAQLDESFEVTQYRLRVQSAVLELVEGDIKIRAQYTFHNAAGQQAGPVVFLNMAVTQPQSDDLKTILADVLHTTNTEIEAATGWTPYDEGE